MEMKDICFLWIIGISVLFCQTHTARGSSQETSHVLLDSVHRAHPNDTRFPAVKIEGEWRRGSVTGSVPSSFNSPTSDDQTQDTSRTHIPVLSGHSPRSSTPPIQIALPSGHPQDSVTPSPTSSYDIAPGSPQMNHADLFALREWSRKSITDLDKRDVSISDDQSQDSSSDNVYSQPSSSEDPVYSRPSVPSVHPVPSQLPVSSPPMTAETHRRSHDFTPDYSPGTNGHLSPPSSFHSMFPIKSHSGWNIRSPPRSPDLQALPEKERVLSDEIKTSKFSENLTDDPSSAADGTPPNITNILGLGLGERFSVPVLPQPVNAYNKLNPSQHGNGQTILQTLQTDRAPRTLHAPGTSHVSHTSHTPSNSDYYLEEGQNWAYYPCIYAYGSGSDDDRSAAVTSEDEEDRTSVHDDYFSMRSNLRSVRLDPETKAEKTSVQKNSVRCSLFGWCYSDGAM